MKIKQVTVNTRKKCIEIDTAKGSFALPFGNLRVKPSQTNKIESIYIDKELADRAVTYTLTSGEEESVHLDDFLEYAQDFNYLRKNLLYRLTIEANELLQQVSTSKRELARRLHTSPSQLYRLLDTANYRKTLDQMVKLLAVLGYQIDITPRPLAA